MIVLSQAVTFLERQCLAPMGRRTIFLHHGPTTQFAWVSFVYLETVILMDIYVAFLL